MRAAWLLLAGCLGLWAQKIEIGELNGAPFRIDLPANYQGTLLVYCHGYGAARQYNEGPLSKNLQPFVDAGLAVAQSAYAAGGWAVKEGIEDTEALRRYFAARYGAPKRTFLMGQSMGGTIALASLESFPESYQGALTLCAPLGPTLEHMQARVFDLLVALDYYFPGAAGTPIAPKPPAEADLHRRLDADPARRAQLEHFAGVSDAAPTAVLSAVILRELLKRAGGNPFDNRNTVYPDADLNRGAKRYAADPGAVDYLRRYYTPNGQLRKPVLAVNGVTDPTVPASSANAYSFLTLRAGTDNWFVQRYSFRPGHCGYAPEEVQHAFADLTTWSESGKRPEPGEQR